MHLLLRTFFLFFRLSSESFVPIVFCQSADWVSIVTAGTTKAETVESLRAVWSGLPAASTQFTDLLRAKGFEALL